MLWPRSHHAHHFWWWWFIPPFFFVPPISSRVVLGTSTSTRYFPLFSYTANQHVFFKPKLLLVDTSISNRLDHRYRIDAIILPVTHSSIVSASKSQTKLSPNRTDFILPVLTNLGSTPTQIHPSLIAFCQIIRHEIRICFTVCRIDPVDVPLIPR